MKTIMTMPIEFDTDSKHELSWKLRDFCGYSTWFILSLFEYMMSLLKSVHNGQKFCVKNLIINFSINFFKKMKLVKWKG
jgi:hypothetical protein